MNRIVRKASKIEYKSLKSPSSIGNAYAASCSIARCIGTRSYLEPNSQSMQKPIGGLSEKIEDRSAIGGSRNQKHAEKTQRHSIKKRQSRAKTNISQFTLILSSEKKHALLSRMRRRNAIRHSHQTLHLQKLRLVGDSAGNLGAARETEA